jgi:hypothetical protein
MALADSLQHKLGPLPTWGWIAIATAGFGVFYLIEKKKASSSTTTPTNTGSASSTTNPPGQGQVPPYVTVDQLTSTNTNSNNTAPVSINSPTTNTGPGAGATTTGGTTNNNPAPVSAPTPTTPTRPTSIVASGEDAGDINRIAIQYGLSEAQLLASNPQLKKMKVKVNGKTVNLVGSGQPVPTGTKINIPAVPAKK